MRAVMCALMLSLPLAGSAGPAALQEPAAAPEWTVQLRLTGGLARLDRDIVIASSGAATATNRSPERTVSEQLAADDLDQVTRLVTAFSINDIPPSTCQTCVTYELTMAAGGRRFVMQMTDRQLSAAGAESLVSALARVLDRMLSQRR